MKASHPNPRASLAALVMIVGGLLFTTGCSAPAGTTRSGHDPAAAATATDLPAQSADDLVVVDCALPGQVRRLGQMVYLSPRRAAKTTAMDCAIRGGEYVAYDRADYATALQVWMPQATEGDKVAQTYVGEIYIRGLSGPPRYDLAAQWFEKAAAQDHPRALINLGFLYEKGLGRPADPAKALDLFRKASGLKATLAMTTAEPGSLPPPPFPAEALQDRLRQSAHESERLRRQLEETRRELERRNTDIGREVEALKRAQEELVQNQGVREADQATQRMQLSQDLAQRKNLLQESQAEVERLKKELARLTAAPPEPVSLQVASSPQGGKDLPGPSIEILDPAPVSTRGVRMVQIREESSGRTVTGRVSAPAGLFSFNFNGEPLETQDSGMFKVMVPVTRSREVAMEFVALDKQGQRASYRFMVSALAEPKMEVKPQDFGAYYALVIGNNGYKHLPRLSTAIGDARDIADLLRRKYGFKVELLLDATRFDILAALNRYRKTLTQKDNLLIYYAGHGELVEENQRGYWLPVDADSDSDVNWLPNYQITDILNITAATQVLVMADTCYAGAMTRSAHTQLETGKTAEERYNWLRTIAQKRSRRVITSGELKPILDSGDGKHSVFASAMLKALEGNEEILEGLYLYRQVAALVASSSERLGLKQVPQYAALIHAGHETGDFLFIPAAN